MDNIDYWNHELGVDLPMWAQEIYEKGGVPVSAIDFYDNIFGDDLEEQRLPDDYVTGEYAGIAIERIKKLDESGKPLLDANGKERWIGRRHTITRENMELYDLIDESENFCMIAPVSYAGRTRHNKNARYLYALTIEIDYIEPKNGLRELFYSWERKVYTLPKPTYIVCSGNGLHLYYVFERPIPLWRNIFEQLAEAKKYFTRFFWSSYVTTAYENVQWESLCQAFRCVGTKGKSNCYAMAFKIGERVTLEYLNQFLPEELQMNCIYKSKVSLEEAKELYPTWYQNRIVDGKEKGHWNRHQPIYYDWIEKIKTGAVVGRRYNCLENLCSLAVQCNISPEQVEKDCRELAVILEDMTNSDDNHFTEYDILCALKTYHTASDQAYRRKIDYISKKTGIPLTPNKRNGRKQAKHLQGARAIRDINNENWREGNGRKSKQDVVKAWQQAHPEGRKADCIRETGLSKPTVYKWWNKSE